MVKNKDMQFCMENLKRKRTKEIFTIWGDDLSPRFSVIFPPSIWIFTEDKDDRIKSRQPSKIFSTLKHVLSWSKIRDAPGFQKKRVFLLNVYANGFMVHLQMCCILAVQCTVQCSAVHSPVQCSACNSFRDWGK